MPAGPAPDLVLIEPNLALGGLKAGLNRPACAGDLDKGGEFCALSVSIRPRPPAEIERNW